MVIKFQYDGVLGFWGRANAVAGVVKSVGARIADIRAYGEREPRVPNTSAANMAQNRRVEIYCLR